MKKSLFLLGAVLVVLLIFVVPVGGRPLMAPDESRYAEIAREMVAGGDWISPSLNGVRYFEKPPMGYWLWSVSTTLFGENPFALRLPGMLATLGSAFFVLLLGTMFLNRKTGLLACGIYLTFPLVFVLGSVAILDPILTFFLTATLALFYLGIQPDGSRKYRWSMLFLSGAMCGGAFLTKGFLAFAIPVVCVVPYLIWNKRWKDLLILPWLPLLGVLVVSLPWAIAIHRAEPDYWHYFFFVEHVQRFFGKEEAQHSEPIYYFIPVLLLGMLQWVLMIPAIVMGLKSKLLKHDFLMYVFCCFLMPFLFFSVSSGKLATYILPCFAPLAILIAEGLSERFFAEGRTKTYQITAIVFCSALVIASIGISINHFTHFPHELFSRAEDWKWGLSVLAALIWAAALLLSLREKKPERKLALFLLGFLPAVIASNLVFPDIVARRKAPTEYLKTFQIPKEDVLVSFRRPFQDVCFAFKRDDVYLFRSKGEIEYGLNYPEAKHRFLPDVATLGQLIAESRAKGKHLYFVSRTDTWLDYKDSLPKPEWIKSDENGADDCYTVVKF